jgi:hypothetical protein
MGGFTANRLDVDLNGHLETVLRDWANSGNFPIQLLATGTKRFR